MRILFVGDVVGDMGMAMIHEYLPQLKRDLKPQVTIVNGENSTPVGRGISYKIYKQLLKDGADVVTMGNHTWDNAELFEFIDDAKRLVRPVNFPGKTPGQGWTKVKVNQQTLAVVNIQGRVFMNQLVDDPFATMADLVPELDTPFVFVDFHGEVTSEKRAFAMRFTGDVSAVVGTHTHVQTSDAQVLDHQTAFLTEVGMTGPADSILGMQADSVITRFENQRPARYTVQTQGPGLLSGCVIDLNDQTGHARAIRPILISPQHPYQS
ncbi:TIGR00282 family metallophosphoesterase [Levilactobacillus namurensis]|uniref:TIGR00282 family metallophosphoesterase n=1 Tax=Levilactobacillus namurensis TaxID=380393 RepID=A0AAW8W6V4_9LACO|nr:TIGR00282 family metallophosphoesterase [Levilactobacillus namurensis]MDT7014128.1 TIGR00282 family metallophosphoesterase [Levilactobacillus namurensis]